MEYRRSHPRSCRSTSQSNPPPLRRLCRDRLACPSIRKRPEVNGATARNPPRDLSISHPPLLSSSERAVLRPLEDTGCGLGSSKQTCRVPTGPRRYSKEGRPSRVAHCNTCRESYHSQASFVCFALSVRVCSTPHL